MERDIEADKQLAYERAVALNRKVYVAGVDDDWHSAVVTADEANDLSELLEAFDTHPMTRTASVLIKDYIHRRSADRKKPKTPIYTKTNLDLECALAFARIRREQYRKAARVEATAARKAPTWTERREHERAADRYEKLWGKAFKEASFHYGIPAKTIRNHWNSKHWHGLLEAIARSPEPPSRSNNA
jgi:hypothetical protein